MAPFAISLLIARTALLAQTPQTTVAAPGAASPVIVTEKTAITGNTTVVTNNSTSADASWSYLQRLLASLPNPRINGHPATYSVEAEITRLSQAASEARTFYARFPKDPRAAEAKKREALSLLQAAQLGDTKSKSRALSAGASYRSDKVNSSDDRFDIAMAMESLNLPAVLGGKRLNERGDIYESLADRLELEFGPGPKVNELYATIVRTTDFATSQRVAQKLKKKDVADAARNVAQQAIDRASAVGKPLTLTLNTIDHKTVPLAAPSGRLTVVFFWNRENVDLELPVLQSLKASVPISARMIYVGMGANIFDADIAKKAPIPGEYCFEPQGLSGGGGLYLPQTPYVYVLTANGRLSGFGQVEDLPGLIRAATP